VEWAQRCGIAGGARRRRGHASPIIELRRKPARSPKTNGGCKKSARACAAGQSRCVAQNGGAAPLPRRHHSFLPDHINLLPAIISMFLLILPACSAGGTAATPGNTGGAPVRQAGTPPPVNDSSSASFTIDGALHGSYTIKATPPTSKLRHGHKEFTIFLTGGGNVFWIVFYGYTGPGRYILEAGINGGDVRIALNNAASWDLTMNPHATCSLLVASDTPTQEAGLDRMQGSFSCPALLSSNPRMPEKPISASGRFDIAIIVES